MISGVDPLDSVNHCQRCSQSDRSANVVTVSRPRVIQILDLLNLSPDIQEALLFLPRVERGRDPVTERELRSVVAEVDWGRQRVVWIKQDRQPITMIALR